jgi:hypothetical protein
MFRNRINKNKCFLNVRVKTDHGNITDTIEHKSVDRMCICM